MTARILNVTPTEYLADPCGRPSLSASIAHTLVTRSPAHAWCQHPRLGNIAQDSTAATDDGSIIHRLLLGDGQEIEVVDAENFRTKAAREVRDAAIARGAVPVIKEKYVGLLDVAMELSHNLAQFGLGIDGDSEVAIEFESDGVLCRSMLDHVFWDAAMVLDIKKIVSADPSTCSRHAYTYGYDIQHAAYSEAFTALKPELAGRLDFIFVFVELEPPYAVVPCRPDGVLVELGKRRWARAKEIWKRCLAKGEWPSYCDDITTLYAPGWAISQEEETD